MQNLLDTLQRSKRILVVTHEHPDGDAIGSAAALRAVLVTLGKVVTVVCRDHVPEPFLFALGKDPFLQHWSSGEFDAVVAVDCGDLRRTGFPGELQQFVAQRGTLLHIDHHPRSDLSKLATHCFEDSTASSTAELLWQVIEYFNVKVTKEIATALLLGLYTDTGGFRHSNTTPRALELGATLLSHGGRLKYIREHVVMHKSIPALKLWGVALERIHRHQMAIVSSVVTQEDLSQTGATEEDIAGIVNMLCSIPQTRMAMLVSEREDNVLKASMRTEDDRVDVGAIAALFGGGGHKKAAGFAIPGHVVVKDGRWHLELLATNNYTGNAVLQEIAA